VSTEISLIQTLEELKEEQAKAYADYMEFCGNVVAQIGAGAELMDQNKRLTSPSRYLSEVPAALRARNKRYENCLSQMNEANVCEQVSLLQAELTESYKDIQELEETIHHLMMLLTESNKAATKLVMKFTGYEKLIKNSSMRDFSEDLAEIRDEVMGLRNTDEEIAKCAERSKLQMEDIKEEMQAIKQEIAEIEIDISYLMDIAEQKAE
jgi:chromosome segregation ATPase